MTARPDPRTLATEAKIAGLTLPEGEAAKISQARQDALSRLTSMGLPQRRDEYWRFTDPALLETDAAPAEVALTADLDALPRLEPGTEGAAIDGAEVTSLARAAAETGHWSHDLFGRLEAGSHKPVARPLAALATAAATKGQVIRVTGKAGQVVLDHGAAQGEVTHSLIRLEPGTELTLIETASPATSGLSLIEIDIAEGATLHHIRLQDGLIAGGAYAAIRLAEGAGYHGFSIGAQGRAIRNETTITLAGRDGRAHIGGAWIGQGASHHDDTVFITHAAPACESRQVYRSVLGRGATAAFQGKILVDQIAQKTDGYQLSQALLLDEEAQFLGKPELEIYADDVKCSHGSTTGSIDETQLFYLRSRGVPERQARHLLVLAFLNETLDEVQDDDLRAVLAQRIERLADEYLA